MLFNDGLHGTLVVETIDSERLRGNPLGAPSRRRLPLYLPPGYPDERESWPLMLALSGHFGTAAGWLGFRAFAENPIQLADRLMANGELPPAVLALPDLSTPHGGAQGLDSPGAGPWQSHLAGELLPWLRENYALDPRREATAVVGKSSGGFAALRLAMTHPELVGRVAVSAADLHFEMTLRPELARLPGSLARLGGLRAFLGTLPTLRRLGEDEARVLQLVALAESYAFDPGAPHGIRWPIDSESGELDGALFDRWLAEDPCERLRHHPGEAAALRSLAVLHVEAGDRDEYHADLGARVFAHRCRQAGIAVSYEEFPGGHFGTSWRYETLFKRALEGLE
jgi:enterochelin esterase-like enzyme